MVPDERQLSSFFFGAFVLRASLPFRYQFSRLQPVHDAVATMDGVISVVSGLKGVGSHFEYVDEDAKARHA